MTLRSAVLCALGIALWISTISCADDSNSPLVAAGRSGSTSFAGQAGKTSMAGGGGAPTLPAIGGITGEGGIVDQSGGDGGQPAGQNDCLRVTLSSGAQKVHSAGIAIDFKVLHCDGSPLVPPLKKEEITIINGETNEEFGSEGTGASDLAPPGNLLLYSVLMLDMSGSIFEYDAQDDVLDGARAYIRALVQPNASDSPELATIKRNHQVALFIFSIGEPIPLVPDFTNDYAMLDSALDDAISLSRMGSTNLYGAYDRAIRKVATAAKPADALVERFAVILTDGSHEAGNGAQLRQQALALRDSSSNVHIFSMGIEAAFDEEGVRELATEAFVAARDKGQIEERFLEIAGTVEAIARSNYSVAICTPVYLGSSTVTLGVRRDNLVETVAIPYNPIQLALDGDTRTCDPAVLLAKHTKRYKMSCTNSCKDDDECNASPLFGVLRRCVGGVCRSYCEQDADCENNPLATKVGDWVCGERGGLSHCMMACNTACSCAEDPNVCDEVACATATDCVVAGLSGAACL